MTWAYFQNQAAWDAYHNAACADHGIPHAGYRQSDGEPMVMEAWTDAWNKPIQVKGTGNVTAWVAHVDPAEVTRYNLGLNIPDSAVTFDQGVVTFTYQGRTYTGQFNGDVGFNWQKAKPTTWTDPNTGKKYDTKTGAVIP